MPRRKLTDLKLNELQAKYREETGQQTRNPNKKSLIKQILEAQAAKRERERAARQRSRPARAREETAAPATMASADAPPAVPASGETPKPPRGRFRNMTIAELIAMYERVVGRASDSSNRAYLIWKIKQAEKGRVRTGPLPERREKGEMQVLPFAMKRKAVADFDAMWRTKGYRSRNRFLNDAAAALLQRLGFDPRQIFDEQAPRSE